MGCWRQVGRGKKHTPLETKENLMFTLISKENLMFTLNFLGRKSNYGKLKYNHVNLKYKTSKYK